MAISLAIAKGALGNPRNGTGLPATQPLGGKLFTQRRKGDFTLLRALYRSSILLLLVLSAAASAQAGQIELISQVHPRVFSDSGMGKSEARSISADGRYLAFLSEASNLVPGQIDHNVGSDVFVYDRVTGTT